MPTAAFVFFCLFYISGVHQSCVDAWGREGHMIIANVAYERLRVESRALVGEILGFGEVTDNNESDPLNSTPLSHVANWADAVRFTRAYHWSGALHYVDIKDSYISGGCPCTRPITTLTSAHQGSSNSKYCTIGVAESLCNFSIERDCPSSFCAVGAISNFTHRLMTNAKGGRFDDVGVINTSIRGTSRRQTRNTSPTSESEQKWRRKEALMFLTHLVGDLHQPLHSSRKSDVGGNSIKVYFNVSTSNDDSTVQWYYGSMSPPSLPSDRFEKRSHWNLHSVWDSGIIEKAIEETHHRSPLGFQQSIHDMVGLAESSGLLDEWLRCSDTRTTFCPSIWAEESLADALRWSYSTESGNEVLSGAWLSEDYFETRLHVVMRRLAAAGVRLAAVLEASLQVIGA